jgi:tetratricopeptide (TPR) repeat protein
LLEGVAAATRGLPQVQLLFAELAFAERNDAAALQHVEAARKSGVSHPLLCNQVGRAYLQLGRWHEAAAVFQQSIDLEPDNPAAWDGLARVHLERDEPEVAVEKALLAVGLIHFFPEAHCHLAMALERSGKSKEAIAAYETALGLGYQPELIHRRLATLYDPLEAGKAARHKEAGQPGKRRMYRADMKADLPSARGKGQEQGGRASDKRG